MKKKNILSLLALLIPVVTGCSSGTGDHYPDPRGIATQDLEAHHIEGTLHDVNVSESSIKFIENGETDYTLIYPKDNGKAQKTALFIADHIQRATKAYLQIKEYDEGTYDSSMKIICLDVEEILDSENISFPDRELGESAYQIETKGNAVFINCKSNYSFTYAAQSFLKHTIGYQRYSKDIVVYEKDGATLPNMHILEESDFTYRIASNFMDLDTTFEMGFLLPSEAIYMKGFVNNYHSSCLYLPADVYYESHPLWYMSPVNTSPYQQNANQICYTAHGDEEEYQALVNELFERIKICLDTDKEVSTFSFTIMDNNNMCMCPSCVAASAKYGAESGSIVVFMNKVDDLVQNYLQEIADATNTPKRVVNLSFFAYNRAEAPCAHKDSTGKFVPNSEEVVCHPNVIPFLAPINADYVDSFYHEENRTLQETFEGWQALSKNMHLWIYETNFTAYMYPFNSYSTMIETYRYCVDKGVDLIYNEGQHNQPAITAFGRFKDYLDSVSQFNVNLDYMTIVDDFFKNYFREADEPMRKMFFEIQEHMAYLRQKYPSDVGGGIYQIIAQSRFWPKKILDGWVELCNEALARIDVYKNSDSALYNILRKNIILESLFPRYALCEFHSGKMTTEEFKSTLDALEADCRTLNVKNYNEGNSIYDRFAGWR